MVQVSPAEQRLPPRRAAPRRQLGAVAWGAISLVALLSIWQLIVSVTGYPSFILPAPALVLQRLLAEWTQGTLPGHTATTLAEALGGFGLALLCGGTLGYVLAHAPRAERVLAPQLAATQAIPVVAVAPLIMLWFGTDIRARILVAALVTFFPVLSATVAALRSIPRELHEVARINGANRWQLIRYVELPLAQRGIFAGVKSGLALATTGAVVGEFLGGSTGLGALLNIARGQFDTPLLFAALITLVLLTLLFYLALSALEYVLDWDRG